MSDNDIKRIFLSQTLDGQLFNMAAQFPDNIAYSDNENNITYQQLCSKIDHIAAVVQNQFADEEIIGLYFDQSVEFIICFFAVIRAGKVSVPLDIKSPENRLIKLAENAKIKTFIKGNNFPDFNITELNVISYNDVDKKEEGQLQLFNDIDKEAVVLYTSGSTGEPKGVAHAHKSLMHHTYRFKNLLNVTHNDRCTLLYSTAYFGGIRDVLSALLNGASLYYYSVEKTGYAHLPEWLTKNKITLYTSVITVFRHLCDAIKGDLKHIDLRAIRIGSDVCLKSDFDNYKELFPEHCTLVSGLASSETGLIRQNVLTKDAVVVDVVSNGYPVEDVEILIKDEQGNNLPEGEIGTLVIASDYLSMGYKNMPELTAEKYKIDSVTGKREFWSGDVGYIKDGYLFFAGRKDSQVKISGRRIDLAEIDAVVLNLKSVTNSIALYYEETKSIVLFIEASKHNPVSKEDIRQYLADNLPFYMQPTRIIILSAFPLGSSFKVNKNVLYEMIKDYEHHYVEATNQYEAEVIKIWQDVLEKDKIGIYDNFFELGGDSINASRVNALLEKKFDIKIPYGYLYQAQTVQVLAKAIESNDFDRQLKWLSLIKPGKGVPLYWLLDGEDTLRKYLPDDQEIYRINTYYDHGIPNRNETVESVCSEFVKEIVQINKTGHCIIGGFSMGARFAYETAYQLKKQGITTDLLILLDPHELKNSSSHESIFKIRHNYRRLKSLYYMYKGIMPPDDFKHDHVYLFHKWLRKKYVMPTPYQGKVLLFQRNMNIPFEQRYWPKVTSPDNLVFETLDTDDHHAVVEDAKLQSIWINKIKELIFNV